MAKATPDHRVRFGAIGAAGLALACGSSASAKTIYVNATATGSGTGNSWANAYTGLQPALARANADDQIWVAQGTYRPASAGGDRAASFFLKTGVALYGGFAGGETLLEQRDWVNHVTTLSGDLNSDDGPNFANTTDNSYHVVVALNTDSSAAIDGFSIVAGYADGPGFGAVPESQDQGSGLNIYFSTPHIENCTFERNWSGNHGTINDHGGATVVNCTFRSNHSHMFGAGLYIHHESATTATGCTFEDNEAEAEGGGLYCRSIVGATIMDSTFTNNRATLGSGMYLAADANPSVSNCVYEANIAQVGGGGIYCDGASPSIMGCMFNDNQAGVTIVTGGGGGGGSGGGGVWCSGGAAVIGDCGFNHNSASFGGGVYNNDDSHASVLGCVFADNIAAEAGGVYTLASDITVAGCLFHDNTAAFGQFSVGGGVSAYFANATVRDCTFIANHADLGGGGLYTEGAAATIQRCRFYANTALLAPEGWGGGILVGYNAAASIINCAFVGNHANSGGGIFNLILSSPLITNCTLVANSASTGGGIQTYQGSNATAVACIAWGNSPSQLDGIALPVSRSCVQGGAVGTGNIAADPRFVRLPGPGADATWGTADDDYGDLRIAAGSGCIDAGDNSAVPPTLAYDLNADPRLRDDPGTPDSGVGPAPVVDMGAYEFQGVTCYANCDSSTSPPVLNVNDFVCFLNRFVARDAYANCDSSTSPPVLNVNDFICFLNKFVAGCS